MCISKFPGDAGAAGPGTIQLAAHAQGMCTVDLFLSHKGRHKGHKETHIPTRVSCGDKFHEGNKEGWG